MSVCLVTTKPTMNRAETGRRLQSAKIKQWIWIVRKWNNSTRLTSNLKFSSPTRENSRFSFGFFLHSPLLAILRCGCTFFFHPTILDMNTQLAMWNCKLIWIFRVVTTRTNFWNANTPRISSSRTENERFYYDKITVINYSITEMSVFFEVSIHHSRLSFFVQISNHYAV